MTSKSSFAIISASVYLLFYLIFLQINFLTNAASILFAFSPVLLTWLTITVIKYGTYKGKELGRDEWGYQDFPGKHPL